jgi:membrane associated rhomboid family serine protease
MIAAPVGFQCPACVKGGPPVRTMRSLRRTSTAYVTLALVAVNVAVFLPTLSSGASLTRRGGGDIIADGALFGPAIANGEWWRLVTSGFLHFGLLHVGFNMLLLYLLGEMLEPALGRVRFGVLYFTALLGGSFGALLVRPDALTAGASGAVFGLMGAAVVGMRHRGVNPRDSGIGGLLVLNLVLTLGGLVAGAAAGWLLFITERSRSWRLAGVAGCVVLGAVAVAGSLAVV